MKMETARWFSLLPAVMVTLKSTSYTNQRYRYAEKLRIQSTYCLEITIFLVYLTPPLTDKQILMILYTDTVYHLRMCLEGPSPKYLKGNNLV